MILLVAALFLAVTAIGCTNGTPGSDTKPANDIDARRRYIKTQELNVTDEARTRKARSIAILKSEDVPVIDHLPVIEVETGSTRRPTRQVATRAMALCLVAAKAEGLEQEIIDRLITEYDLASEFTPNEKEFIGNPEPTEHERIQFLWRYECYWVLLWSLGYVDTLERPDTICDVEQAVSILVDKGRNGFLENARLRPQSEILDAADLIYRYHWAVVDARINNREGPAGLDAGIVMERHYALNWLIGYMDQEWDDVSTDT